MPAPKPLNDRDPDQIGPYRLTGFLGAGGQGTVYLGVGPDGTQAAIKTLHPHFARNDADRRRFVREVEIARKISAYRRGIGQPIRTDHRGGVSSHTYGQLNDRPIAIISGCGAGENSPDDAVQVWNLASS